MKIVRELELDIADIFADLIEGGINDYERAVLAVGLKDRGWRKCTDKTVDLPCKPGDTVYRLTRRRGVWYILPREVVSVTYRLDYKGRVQWEIFSTESDILGRSVFLSIADAENALPKWRTKNERTN